ncbi:MAG: hypothetical protein GXY07_08665 [Candidatus Hydrogenedentes bacterium]|nr:hypothetical protein [Candidatus Hydrogenedentota bacterium]
MNSWLRKGMLAALLAVLLLTVMGCQQNPLIGKWECIAYANGNTAANLLNEVFVFNQDGTFTWITSRSLPRKTFYGTYTVNTQANPFSIDVIITKYSTNGLETDIPDVSSLGVYKFTGSGDTQRLYLNHTGGATRPSASTLDKEVGPVWVGNKVNEKWLDLAEKGLDTLLGAWGVSAFSGS